MTETTAFGAALAAGKAANLWDLKDERAIPITFETYNCTISEEDRQTRYNRWKKAVQKSMGWDESHVISKQ